MCLWQTATAVPLFNNASIGLTLEVLAQQTEEIQPVHLVVILDRSGSMAGAPIREAHRAISELYQSVLSQQLLASNVLLAFDNSTERYLLTDSSQEQAVSTVQGIYARGGTDFTNALQALQGEIHAAEEGSSFFVAFFTDGQARVMAHSMLGCNCIPNAEAADHRLIRLCTVSSRISAFACK